jgi:bile acid-coenzyme A ligase
MPVVSFARRFTELAEADPQRPLVTCDGAVGGSETLTRADLESRANRLARELAGHGVGIGDMVTIALPNSVDWFVAAVAAWKLGATPQPVSARLPTRELEAIVELADPPVVIGAEPGAFPGRTCLAVGHRPPDDLPDDPLPDVTSPHWKAPTSGGSTGRPKLIVAGDPARIDTDSTPLLFIDRDGCMLVPGPLYHNGPIVWACTALIWGAHVVVTPRFGAEETLAAIERHRADVIYLVPTMMKRIWRLPEDVRNAYDLSSIRFVWHLAEPCPAWLKEAWIDWLGPERIVELYAGTEGQLATVIMGTDWLEHRGSVGRPLGGSVMICDPDGNEVAPGEMGEVWLRSDRETPSYHYVGAEARGRDGGWESLGDMGWVDEDGYLYLGDRQSDMILVGGANVYPAEVEAALQEHPGVHSCVVIGLPDEDKGHRVHAIVEADPAEAPEAALLAFLAERVARYKLPRSIEYTSEPLRDDAGKVRRSRLRDERASAT